MSKSPKIPQGMTKPRVAIVYSSSTTKSGSSERLAFYLACCFARNGYCDLWLIPNESNENIGNLQDLPRSRRFLFVPPNSSKSVEIPVSRNLSLYELINMFRQVV